MATSMKLLGRVTLGEVLLSLPPPGWSDARRRFARKKTVMTGDLLEPAEKDVVEGRRKGLVRRAALSMDVARL